MLSQPVEAASLLSSPATPMIPTAGAASDCHNPGVSADGRFVVFVSAAGNLVTNDANGVFDVFVRDRQLSQTILVSVNYAGTGSGNGPSQSPTISANGRYVTFESSASDLVTNDANNAADVFVRDLVANTTTLVSQTAGGSSGNQASTAPTLTPDGRFVLFCSQASDLVSGDSNLSADLFVRDMVLGTNVMVTRSYLKTTSHAGLSVTWDSNRLISDDGRWVAFQSTATNLIQGDPNGVADVFVRDRLYDSNVLASVNTAGTGFGNASAQNASLDASGRYVAFQSASTNLNAKDLSANLDVYRRDLVAHTTVLASANTNGTNSASGSSGNPVLSRSGNALLFLSTANDLVAGDTNTSGADLFLRDFTAGTTVLVDYRVASSVDTPGPALSADGRFALYRNGANNLMLYDAVAHSRTVVATNPATADGIMTDDAQFITYLAQADLAGVQNIYLFNRAAGTTELVSRHHPALTNATGSASSRMVPGALSADGRVVAFESFAGDLTTGDTNGTRDVWVADYTASPSTLTRLSNLISGFARGPSRRPVVSGDGRWLAFEAIPDGTPNTGLATRYSLYVFDRQAGTNGVVAGVGSVVAPAFAVFSQSGGKLAFQSSETGVAGYASTIAQIYYRDPVRGTNRLVSHNYAGTAPATTASSSPVISPDGRYVAYLSAATDLVTTTTAGVNAYLWDSTTGVNYLASRIGTGTGLNQISRVNFGANGTLLTFQNPTTTYVWDISTRAVTIGYSDAANATLSADGRFLACERTSPYSVMDTNSVADVYVIDRPASSVALVSVNLAGNAAGKGRSFSPTISPDARYVLFRSSATNLVANDTNGFVDIFLRDRQLNRTILVSRNFAGTGSANRFSINPQFSANGNCVLFESYASDLMAGDFNQARDIFRLQINHGDSDGDGLPDDWELAYFNTLDRDGTGDFDRDGMTDLQEYLAGTDPTNAGSVLPVLTLSQPAGGPVRILWSAISGKTYRVQYKAALGDPGWTDLPGDVLATDVTAFKDDAASPASTQRFYRVTVIQ